MQASDMAMKWESVRWPDGATYEGVTKNGVCHERGVFTYANGDRYEGEFQENSMHGYGVYVWRNGTIYRGEWRDSNMQGCGVKLAKNGNHFTTEEGLFADDEWVGAVMACSVEEARSAASEADLAASMARAFQLPTDYKPRNRNQNTRAPAEAVGKVADIKDVQISRPRRFRWFGRQPEPDLQPYQ